MDSGITAFALRVTNFAELRVVKAREKTVYPQQSRARQSDRIAIDDEKTLLGQNIQLRRERLANVRAKFRLEIIGAHFAQLQLQHELAHQLFPVAQAISA